MIGIAVSGRGPVGGTCGHGEWTVRDGEEGRVCQSYRTNKPKKSSQKSFLTRQETSMVPSLLQLQNQDRYLCEAGCGAETLFLL